MVDEGEFISKGNSFLNAVRSIRKHTNAAQKRKIVFITALVFVSAILDVVGLAAVLPIIQAGTDPDSLHANKYLNLIFGYFGFEDPKMFVLFLLAVIVVFFLVKTAFGIFVNWLQARLNSDIAVYLSKKQFTKYYHLDYLDYSSLRTSELVRNILYNPTSYVQWIMLPMTTVISEMFIVILIVGAIAWYDLFLLGFIAITIGPATYLVYTQLKKKGFRIGVGIHDVTPYVLATLNEAIHGHIDLKLADRIKYYRARFLDSVKSYAELQQSASLLSQIPLRTNEVIALFSIVLIFLYALFISGSDTDVLMLVGAFAAAAYRLMPSMNRLLNAFTFLSNNQIAIHNLDLFEDKDKSKIRKGPQEPVTFNDSIELKNVSFSFPGTSKSVLNDLSFVVKKGEKIGFVGSSGSGKTTLMNLILRFYPENSGSVLVDGVKLTDRHTDAWRRIIGYVKQDIFLIDGSIKDNITLSEENPDIPRLMNAIHQASLDDLVASLPDGIESSIGEKGGKLSGGQRQRLGIARSLYRNAQVLIFDEATSALDTATENEVSEAIDALSGSNKTIFIIAHRITTLKNCDRIYELKNGSISGVYSYKEMLAKVI